MRFEIVHELPGRLRTRSGRRTFSQGQGYALQGELTALDGVDFVRATPNNGGLLLRYQGGEGTRVRLLAAIERLDMASIPEIEPSAELLAMEANGKFFWKIISKLAFFFGARFILPLQVRTFLTFWRYRAFFMSGLRSLCCLRLDVPVLDAVAIGASLATGQGGAARSIMLMLDLSEKLQEHTQRKARFALTDSLSHQVDVVWLLNEDGVEHEVPIQDVKLGDMLAIRMGAMIPVDGMVMRGEAEVNEASMTGESIPVHKRKGLSVYSGTTIEQGGLIVKVTACHEGTRMRRIMHLLEQSEELKARVQCSAEHLADKIVPYSLATSALTGLATRNMQRAMSVLMVDYSCALKLATPIVVLAAMKEATSSGIVIKGAKYLEAMSEVDTIVFDKTGTLTTATPHVVKVKALGAYTEEEILRTAACIEEHFPHSMAQAIVREASSRGLQHEEFHAEVNYIVAHGVCTTIEGKRALVGSAHYIFEDEAIALDPEIRAELEAEAHGLSIIYLAMGDEIAGCIYLEDEPRQEAPEVIEKLRDLGIKRIIMLTGDGQQAAQHVAKLLGITEYKAHVLPEDKASYIQELKAQGCKVAMVGDGVNDSPAMSCADVAISMKNAADLAREVSDVTLLSPSLDSLVELRELSCAAIKRVHRNYRFIVGFNSSLIALGSLGLLTPTISALLHNLSTFGVCLSSTRPLLGGPSFMSPLGIFNLTKVLKPETLPLVRTPRKRQGKQKPE